MKSKRTRPVKTRTKVHILTGGLKEDVSQLELNGGELISGENVQEIDGVYHGYSSLPGYEVCWGDNLPSEIDAPLITDAGLTNDVKLLVTIYEGGIIDAAASPTVLVVSPDVIIDTTTCKFESGAIYNPSTGVGIEVPESVNLNVGSSDWEFDCVVRGVSTGELLNLGGGLIVGLAGGFVTVALGLNGTTALTTNLTSARLVSSTKSVQIAVNRKGTTVRLAIDGVVDENTYEIPLATDYLTYSGTSNVLSTPGFIEEVRLCVGSPKWVYSYDPPEVAYLDEFFVYRSQYDDLEREAVRAAVEPVGGADGTGGVLAVSFFSEEMFAVRGYLGSSEAVFAKSLHPSKCSNVGTTGPAVFPLGGTYQFARGSFFAFGDCISSFTSYIRKEVLFLTTGKTPPVWFDGLGYRQIDHAGLPDNDATSPEYAISARVFKDRLFLGYPSGRVVFSAAGDPLDFSVIDGAGFFYLPPRVTDLISAPGDSLIMFTRGSINIAKTLADAGVASSDSTYAYKFFNEDFSQSSGCVKNTAQRIMGIIIFMDDRGISSLETTDAFGDFNAGSLSRNVQRTLLRKKNLITCSTVIRENNQYRLFFSDKTGLILTFDANKKVKGITSIRYNTPVMCVDTQKDSLGNEVILFGSSDGFVYKMDSGTSFNGLEINTKVATAFYNYSSPAFRKRFRKVTLESSAPRGLIFYGKLEFDYKSSNIPRGITEELESAGAGGTYGQDVYGKFTYGSTAVETPTLYDDGYGENMSVTITTSDKYRSAHTINSMIVEYVVVNRVHA